MKNLLLIVILLLLTSCISDNEYIEISCDCSTEISGDIYNQKTQTSTPIIPYLVYSDITDCDRDGEQLWNKDGHIGTVRCKNK